MAKRSSLLLIVATILLFCACTWINRDQSGQEITQAAQPGLSVSSGPEIRPEGKTLIERFIPPPGYLRPAVDSNSFAFFLQNLPLKPQGSEVSYFDGTTKPAKGVYLAVVDYDLSSRDLQQCADAIIRLRAEYLYLQGHYEQIRFNFTSGDTARFTNFAEGFRPVVLNNKVSWSKKQNPDYSYSGLRNYLEVVYQYAGTYSLEKEMTPLANPGDMKIGDVFIQGGFPGHGVVVADMAENENTGEKIFILVQSYMPAQDIQVLVNPQNENLSPWYRLAPEEDLSTPEWQFNYSQLRRFWGE